jgi:hypothetical protein
MAERYTVDVDVEGSKPFRLPSKRPGCFNPGLLIFNMVFFHSREVIFFK